MELGYFAADTLGMTLYQNQGRLAASEIHQITLGPWRMGMQMDVESDLLGGRELGFWVTLSKTLRLYAVVRQSENWLLVLSTPLLEQCGAKTGFEAATVKGRILEIKPAILAVFHWSTTSEGWRQVQYDGSTHAVNDLDQDRARTGVDESVACVTHGARPARQGGERG
jgi:hypothetical protein